MMLAPMDFAEQDRQPSPPPSAKHDTDASVAIEFDPDELPAPVDEIEPIDLTAAAVQASVAVQDEDDDYYFVSSALLCLSIEHPLRAFAIRVVTARWFELLMLLVAIIASGFVAALDPLKGVHEGFNNVCYYTDVVFLIFFTTEAVFKIVAMGFILHPRSYMRGVCSSPIASLVQLGILFSNLIKIHGTGSTWLSSCFTA